MTDVFDRIYRHNLWNGVESRSGPGSGSAATEPIARELVALVAELGIASVLDVACGDGFWMPNLPGYVGIDVAPEAIRLARARHPDRPYLVADARSLFDKFDIGGFDLVIVRDAIQHLPLEDGVDAIEAIVSSGSRRLLASTYQGGENIDIVAGDCFSPDLEAAPYSLGAPERLIFDGWTYHDSTAVRDPRKHLGLWSLTRPSVAATLPPIEYRSGPCPS